MTRTNSVNRPHNAGPANPAQFMSTAAALAPGFCVGIFKELNRLRVCLQCAQIRPCGTAVSCENLYCSGDDIRGQVQEGQQGSLLLQPAFLDWHHCHSPLLHSVHCRQFLGTIAAFSAVKF